MAGLACWFSGSQPDLETPSVVTAGRAEGPVLTGKAAHGFGTKAWCHAGSAGLLRAGVWGSHTETGALLVLG